MYMSVVCVDQSVVVDKGACGAAAKELGWVLILRQEEEGERKEFLFFLYFFLFCFFS